MELLGFSVLGVAKIFTLFALGLYVVFALVVVKQVSLMISTIEVGLDFIIRLIAWGHLIFAVIVFLSAMIIL